MYYRGLAHLAMHNAELATVQFQNIYEHRAVALNSLYVTVAGLGLARAHLLTNELDNARGEYERFFDLWKDADSDVPILLNAKVEYANLK